MNITPEQARSFAEEATLKVETLTHIEKDQVFYSLVTDDDRLVATDIDKGDAELLAIAPDLAQTIAGMTEEWGVERDRPGTAYIDGTVARWINWVGDEARARKACVISPRGGNPRLVRRLVGPVEEA